MLSACKAQRVILEPGLRNREVRLLPSTDMVLKSAREPLARAEPSTNAFHGLGIANYGPNFLPTR
jgi:hypothetical protein